MNTREEIQAEELDAYLTARLCGDQSLSPAAVPEGERALLDELAVLAEKSLPDAGFAAELEHRLRAAARKRLGSGLVLTWRPRRLQALISQVTARGARMNRWALYGAGALALVAMIVVSLSVLGGERQPGGMAHAPTSTPPEDEWETPIPSVPPTDQGAVVEAPAVTPVPGPDGPPLLPSLAAAMGGGSGGGGQGGEPISSETPFELGTTLPENPERVPAYVQLVRAPSTSADVGLIANGLGLEAQVYEPRPYDEDEEARMYVAIDEPRRVWLHTGEVLYEHRGRPDYGYPPVGAPPLDSSTEVAVRFLEDAGLLETPYQVVATTNVLRFHRVVGSGWLVSQPYAEVFFSPDGQVSSANYHGLNLQEVGQYDIISAQEAWDILISREASDRVWYELAAGADLLPWGDWGDWARHNPRRYSRGYVSGQSVHLFGGLQTFYPVESGDQLHVTMGDLVLAGDVQPLAEAYQALVESTGAVDVPIHVWGEVMNGDGFQILRVEGWQVEEWEDSALSLPYQWTGTIRRSDGQTQLLTDSGAIVPIADLPADLLDGTFVFVVGGQVDGTLEWYSIQESPVDQGVPDGSSTQREHVRATVEQVELIYLVPRANYVPPEFDWGYRAPQPAWLFKGHTDQGSAFRVYVQAVVDQQLAPTEP